MAMAYLLLLSDGDMASNNTLSLDQLSLQAYSRQQLLRLLLQTIKAQKALLFAELKEGSEQLVARGPGREIIMKYHSSILFLTGGFPC